MTAPIVFAFFWYAAFCELFLEARVTSADVTDENECEMEKGIISTFSVRVRKSSSPFRVDCIKVLLHYKGNQCSLLTQGMYDLLIFSLVATNLGNLGEFTVEGRHAVS